MEQKIYQIQNDYLEKIQKAEVLKELDEVFLALFGKKGEITLLSKQFPGISKEELQKLTPLFNSAKQNLEQAIEEKRGEVREKSYKRLESEKFDLTEIPEVKKRQGHLHPLTAFEHEIVKLFSKIGFLQFEAPEIDTDDYNFGLLNIPENHPARDLWDTLYIDNKPQVTINRLLLRTHTSNAQVRILRKYKPPIRMMVLGRCFRYERTDARHEHTFDQFEIVYVDKNLSMANLQYLSEYFLHSVLDKDIKVRLRPKYYPFVEPGVGIDGECIFCTGKGCKVCGGVGWLEVGGAGMIHPQVLKNGGIDPKEYTGIAWGPGLERILMLKLGVSDLRLFRSGDLRFLQKL